MNDTIQLELDRSEYELLDQELRRVIEGVRVELVHTTARAYREMVRERLDALERLEARVAEVRGAKSDENA